VCAFVALGLLFSIPGQEIGLGNVSKMTYFVSSGRKTRTQSVPVTHCVGCFFGYSIAV